LPDIGELTDAPGTREADALRARFDGWTALFATCGPSASPTEEAPTAAVAVVVSATVVAVGEASGAVAAFDAMVAFEELEEPGASLGVVGVPELPDGLFVVAVGSLLVFAGSLLVFAGSLLVFAGSLLVFAGSLLVFGVSLLVFAVSPPEPEEL
jgi:hypothetical protein